MSNLLCKGGCGSESTYKGWCCIKWISGKRFATKCPEVEKRRGRSISKYRLKEARQGKNPMQNPLICSKNHSPERNRKASLSLKELGMTGSLPQQKENKQLRDKRRKHVAFALKKLWLAGKHPRQLETKEKRKARLKKTAETLRELGKRGLLPVQNLTKDQKVKIAMKISKKLREGIRSGKIALSKGWKQVPYKDLVLRSRWERTVAEFLDKIGIIWEYETLRIDYFDTTRGITAVTIPDFYIPSLNTVIEVKSNAFFKSQQTKDKMNAIKESGFKALLVGRREIALIKENAEQFKGILLGDNYETS